MIFIAYGVSIIGVAIIALVILLTILLSTDLNPPDRVGLFILFLLTCLIVWLLWVGGHTLKREISASAPTAIEGGQHHAEVGDR